MTRREGYCANCGAPTNGGELCDRCASRRGLSLLRGGKTLPELVWHFQVCGWFMARYRAEMRKRRGL